MDHPPIAEWLDSPACRAAPQVVWYRRRGGLLLSINRAGRGYSHALGRLPQPVPQAELWSEGARNVLLADVVTSERVVGAIGPAGWVWVGDGWSGLHTFLTEAEHRATAAYRRWLEDRTGVLAPRLPAVVVQVRAPVQAAPPPAPTKPGKALQLTLF